MAESKIAERAAEQTGGNSAADFWTGIERMLADLAAQAKAEPLPDDFPARVLTWLHEVLATEAESFWQQDLHGRLRQRARHAPAPTPSHGASLSNGVATKGQTAGDEAGRVERINSVLASGAARSAPAAAHDDSMTEAGAKPDQTWLLCPIRSEGGTAAVIEVLHQHHAGPNQQLAVEVLQSVAELCGDYLRRFQLQEYARERNERDELAQFNRRIHDSIDLQETAYAIVNEGRRVIGCDRLTVLACRGPACEVLAISGAAHWDRRSNSVMRLEELCATVAAGGGPLASGGLAADLPPQVRNPLDAYLEAAQVREVLVLPLVRPPTQEGDPTTPIGVLVIEQFSGVLTEEHRDRTAEACTACLQALDHALIVQRIPWAGLFLHRDWRALSRRGHAALLVAFGAVVLFSAACLIPADFEVEARGVLQPRSRRDVFAPDDGVVDGLFVDHGTPVTKGQPLVALRNPQLDLDLKRVWGELQAAQRLAAIETAAIEERPLPVQLGRRRPSQW